MIGKRRDAEEEWKGEGRRAGEYKRRGWWQNRREEKKKLKKNFMRREKQGRINREEEGVGRIREREGRN